MGAEGAGGAGGADGAGAEVEPKGDLRMRRKIR